MRNDAIPYLEGAPRVVEALQVLGHEPVAMDDVPVP